MKDSNQHEPDDYFRKGLENLSEESPGHQDWEQLLPRLKKEGLIGQRRKRKRFFLILPVAAAIFAFLLTFYHDQENTPYFQERKKMVQKHQEKFQNPVTYIKDDSKAEQQILSENLSGISGHESTTNKTNPVSEVISSQPAQQLAAVAVLKKDVQEEIEVEEITSGIQKSKQDKTIQPNEKKNSIVTNLKEPPAAMALKETTAQSLPIVPSSENTEALIAATNIKDSIKTRNDSAITEISAAIPTLQDSAPKTIVMPASENRESKTSKNTRRFYIGYYSSGDINYYALKDTRNTKYGESDYVLAELKRGNDTPAKQLQFTTGVMGGYSLSNYFSIETGVLYSQKKKVQQTIYVPKYNTEYGESATDYTYSYHAKYVELFGKLKYYLSKSKFNLYIASGGIGNFNFPVSEEKKGYFTRSFYGETTMPSTEKIILQPGSLTLSAVLSPGIEIRLSEKWGLYAEPSYKYAFNPVIKHPDYDQIPVNHYVRALSLGIGCTYKF